ncbi:MAG: site-specific integrase, partial [Saprospiraceae bacterium]
GYNIEKRNWLEDKQLVSSKCRTLGNVTRVNNRLLNEKTRILDILLNLQKEGILNRLSMVALKDRLLEKDSETMTLAFFNTTIAGMEQSKRYGNARVYNTVSRSIFNYMEGRDFPLKQITYSWLKQYEAWYLSKGNALNGLSVNMRTLRSLYNMAIKQKKISSEYYPFADYTIRKEETRKRAISRDDLIHFLQYEPKTDRHKRAKDYFLISFYLMGASFVDIAFLKLKDIIQNRIEYKRQKTGKLHSIPVSKPLQEILNKYLKVKKENYFILGIVKSDDPKKQLIEIRDELRRYNRSLKEIGALCGIESSISSYVARHSYATSAKKIGVPIAIISESLGHSTEKTTQIYLDSFENDVIDKYHDMVIDLPNKVES